ncbi:MAG: GNAT family protein [Streptosporangiaceae bacterium]|jgi:RimJ/RimL family protein N-acetyltransferase
MGDLVTLRPVSEDDLTVVEKLTWDPETAGEFALFGWFDPMLWRRRWAANGLISDDGGMLMVVRGADRLGFVSWRYRRTTPAAYCIEMGIALLPEARGHGHGTQAHRLLARYLLAHTTVHRIEAATDVDNLAEQKALEHAGFTREGVMRGCGWRDGAWRDGVTYSLLRTDPPG